MPVTDYLVQIPATFNELAEQFATQTARADGVLESSAGELAADVFTHLALLKDRYMLTSGQLWSAIAAERGSVGACNMLANVARAVQAQLIANKPPEPVHQSPPGHVADGPEHAQAKGGDDNADDKQVRSAGHTG